MNSKAEVSAWMEILLEKHLDDCLNEQGFSRRKRALEYRRDAGESQQRVLTYWHFRPKYAPGALVHFYPKLRISLPHVNRLALELAGDATLIGNMKDATLEQPVDFTAPKKAQERWLLFEEHDLNAVGPRIEAFFRTWVIPFVNQFTNAASIIASYEAGDSRILNQQHWSIFVAASHLAQGSIAEAKRVLEKRYSAAGLKQRFQHAFDYLNRASSETD